MNWKMLNKQRDVFVVQSQHSIYRYIRQGSSSTKRGNDAFLNTSTTSWMTQKFFNAVREILEPKRGCWDEFVNSWKDRMKSGKARARIQTRGLRCVVRVICMMEARLHMFSLNCLEIRGMPFIGVTQTGYRTGRSPRELCCPVPTKYNRFHSYWIHR
jgi:hypothetical protein